jgi:hypothetical protein
VIAAAPQQQQQPAVYTHNGVQYQLAQQPQAAAQPQAAYAAYAQAAQPAAAAAPAAAPCAPALAPLGSIDNFSPASTDGGPYANYNIAAQQAAQAAAQYAISR